VSREKEGKKKRNRTVRHKRGKKRKKKEGGTKSDRGKLKNREQRW
jgi:hypothetical protein